ncbi:aminopeptidase N [Tepidicaulis sp. LMO-SS28]|uniref:aminopeptidase N n=1 Tax=Tepidicaulis sp. LMO-SS28 TaxID=3447455 RepID=UPI003EDFD381
MRTEDPRPILLKEYSEPDYWIDEVHLDVALDPEAAEVKSRLSVRPNAKRGAKNALRLDGEKLELMALSLNGEPLGPNRYQVDAQGLTIMDVPDAPFTLDITTRCNPAANTALTGLYLAGGIFCTQCEAEGFRRITYMLDRPDVMAVYKTRITAPKSLAPVLLANGNCTASGDLPDGKHFAEWHDPYPKPSYLFALVAGDLAHVQDSFTTASGRKVDLRIYVEPGNEDRCAYAMDALKRAMAWDEKVFGREYDLDIFMIVAVSAFNMGAMENKGLNIFNDKYILARPDTATDLDYANIEAIVAHEYFHNWTGNRITCRDWFQLCLKEGLTVFRDQEFTADMRSRAVKRISDVRTLRTHQFPEDGGPLAHPVRPDSYIEINNFYTATVYEKGAELVRMLHTLLGAERFRKGMDLYFERHDGEAATVEDFLTALADGGGLDLAQFKRWYGQAGTPEVIASGKWDQAKQEYALTLSQISAPTPSQPHKEPLHIPVETGLIAEDGRDVPLHLAGGAAEEDGRTSRVLSLTQREQCFRFTNVAERAVPSLLRGFTAPVKLSVNLTDRDWAFLMAHDSDPFNRWEAAQKYATSVLTANVAAIREGVKPRKGEGFAEIVRGILREEALEPEFVAQMIVLPAEQTLAQSIGQDVDVDAIHEARESLRASLGGLLKDDFLRLYDAMRVEGTYSPDADHAGRRSLRNSCLSYLAAGGGEDGLKLAKQQFDSADNMTDSMASLTVLAHTEGPAREEALKTFHDRWQHDHLVMDKWFALQATSPLPGTLDKIKELMAHPAFSLRNPNKVRALIGTFAAGNQLRFHAADGSGYRFVADQVSALDKINPQVAARILGAFKSWRQFEPGRRAHMKDVLERIAAEAELSRDVYEIATKTLGQN